MQCREAKNEPMSVSRKMYVILRKNVSVLLDKLKEQMGNFDGRVSSNKGNIVILEASHDQ